MPFPLTKLFLLLTFILFYSHTNCQSTSQDADFEIEGTIPGDEALPQITINPGVTRKVTITLKGVIDTIVMTFQEDAYEPESFKLFIKKNNQIDSTQMVTFLTEEHLSLTLDPSRSLLVLQGDKKFRLSKYVREKQYDVTVLGYLNNDTSDVAAFNSALEVDSSQSTKSSSRTTTYFILAGIIAGLLGLVILIKTGGTIVRKIKQKLRRTRSIFTFHSRTSNKGKEGDIEAGGVTPVLQFEENPGLFSPKYKGSLTLEDRAGGENEIDIAQQQFQKKEFPSSLTSIESGTGNAKSTTASTISVISSSGSLQNIVAKKGPRLASITEEISYVKPHLPPLGPLKVPPLKFEEASSKSRNSYTRKLTNSKIAPTMSSSMPSIKSLQALPESNASKMSKAQKENQKEERKVVTMADIKKLVDKVMREKKNEEVDDSEEESSKDDGGDTPNYFSCLVCYKERRSAVAEPCGHVFACLSCTKRVMGSSKGCCALCHNKIKGYHPLKG